MSFGHIPHVIAGGVILGIYSHAALVDCRSITRFMRRLFDV